MLVTIKYFYETDLDDHENYQMMWNDNEYRMIFLPMHLNETQQAIYLSRTLQSDPDKDILAIKTQSFIERNSIFRQIKNGLGFGYNRGAPWCPSEVWIYVYAHI